MSSELEKALKIVKDARDDIYKALELLRKGYWDEAARKANDAGVRLNRINRLDL